MVRDVTKEIPNTSNGKGLSTALIFPSPYTLETAKRRMIFQSQKHNPLPNSDQKASYEFTLIYDETVQLSLEVPESDSALAKLKLQSSMVRVMIAGFDKNSLRDGEKKAAPQGG